MNVRRRRFAWEAMVLVMLTGILTGDGLGEQGAYFAKKKYVPKPLPVFGAITDKLPAPIYTLQGSKFSRVRS